MSREDKTVSGASAHAVDPARNIANTRDPENTHDHEKRDLHGAPIDQQAGVSKVEAFNRALYNSGGSGRLLLYVLVVSIGLTMFAYALDQGITYQFDAIAASSFQHHAQLGAVNTASTIIRALAKPFLGKLSDITSRPTSYVVVLVFYAIGFAVAASSSSLAAYIVGVSFTSFAKSGLDLLGDIIVGDLTPLQWRAFWSSMLSVPFLVTTFINGFISDAFVPDNWRWGMGMFAIMIPVLLVPAIWTLYSMQSKAKRMDMVSMGDAGLTRRGGARAEGGVKGYLHLVRTSIIEVDLVGLLLLGLGVSLILLALNLAPASEGGWSNPSMIAMLVVGFVILLAFVVFEAFLAPRPIAPRRLLKNKTFLAAMAIDSMTLMGSSVRENYFPSYIYIIKDWSNYAWTIFIAGTTLSLCFISPIGGLIHRLTHRYKTLLVIGGVAKVIGDGILIENGTRSTGATSKLVAARVVLGFGAWTVIGTTVSSQASVPHQDLATVISVISLASTIASSIGTTIGASIWQSRMVGFMREELPDGTPEETIEHIYGSIKNLKIEYPYDDPIRQGAIAAYKRTNGILFATSCAISGVSLLVCFLMPNYYLGKQQNVVTQTGLDGSEVDVPVKEEDRDRNFGWWQKTKRAYYRET